MSHEDDHKQLVELGIFHTEMEAELLVNRLKGAGIEARTFSAATGGLGFMSDTTFPHGGAQVAVPEKDLDAARRILAEFQAEQGTDEEDSDETA